MEKAKAGRAKIVLENLRHIRWRHAKGDGEGRNIRGRLHRWSFGELQRQIGFKAKWEGIAVQYVSAANTSKRCFLCGFINKALGFEKCWTCPNCGVQHDRDLNAAKNILVRSLGKEAAVVRRSNEGELREGMVQFAAVTR